jgi:hypothetical protein
VHVSRHLCTRMMRTLLLQMESLAEEVAQKQQQVQQLQQEQHALSSRLLALERLLQSGEYHISFLTHRMGALAVTTGVPQGQQSLQLQGQGSSSNASVTAISAAGGGGGGGTAGVEAQGELFMAGVSRGSSEVGVADANGGTVARGSARGRWEGRQRPLQQQQQQQQDQQGACSSIGATASRCSNSDCMAGGRGSSGELCRAASGSCSSECCVCNGVPSAGDVVCGGSRGNGAVVVTPAGGVTGVTAAAAAAAARGGGGEGEEATARDLEENAAGSGLEGLLNGVDNTNRGSLELMRPRGGALTKHQQQHQKGFGFLQEAGWKSSSRSGGYLVPKTAGTAAADAAAAEAMRMDGWNQSVVEMGAHYKDFLSKVAPLVLAAKNSGQGGCLGLCA